MTLGLEFGPDRTPNWQVSVVSFDIDGTLAAGDPPGLIGKDDLLTIVGLGCVIGSASDNPVRSQKYVWSTIGIEPTFTVLKHRLAHVRSITFGLEYWHVGDGEFDAHVAMTSHFGYLQPREFLDLLRPYTLASESF
jgi:hypothetical protein